VGTEAPARALGVAAGSGGALALALLTSGLAPERGLAFALVIEAIAVALAAPTVALRPLEKKESRSARRALEAFLAFALVLVLATALRGGSPASALLAQLYVLLHAAALFFLSRAASERLGAGAGLALGLGAGLLLLGAPYFTGDAIGALPHGVEERAIGLLVVFSPALALPGSFAGLDVLRGATLYDRFAPVQDVPWSYATPVEALLAQALFAGLMLGASLLLRRRRESAPSATP
jgi:hypothetical protein